MLARDLRNKLAEFELSQVEFARLVGVTPRTVNMWLQGDREIPGPIEAYVRLFELVPISALADEIAKARGKDLVMKEGMYQIQFHADNDPGKWGVGSLIFESGRIYGADAGGAKYDGEYETSPNPELVDVKIRVTFPANGMSIFGIANPYEWSLGIRTQLDRRKDSGIVQVQTDVGPAFANYLFVRSIPEAT
jgi:transcriptional regulator with XRE-family HTH domain